MPNQKTFTAVRANPARTVTIEAYVPNRDRNGVLVHNHEQWVKLVENALCEVSGGGCTTYEVRGCWRGSYEQTTIVRASVAVPPTGYVDELLKTVAQTLGAFGAETDQVLAGFTVDGVWYWAVLADGAKA